MLDPAFLALLALEIAWARRHPEVLGFEPRDTSASLAMGVLNVIVAALAGSRSARAAWPWMILTAKTWSLLY